MLLCGRLGLGVLDDIQCISGEGDGGVAIGLRADADVEVNTPVFSKVFLKDFSNVFAKTL